MSVRPFNFWCNGTFDVMENKNALVLERPSSSSDDKTGEIVQGWHSVQTFYYYSWIKLLKYIAVQGFVKFRKYYLTFSCKIPDSKVSKAIYASLFSYSYKEDGCLHWSYGLKYKLDNTFGQNLSRCKNKSRNERYITFNNQFHYIF